MKLDIPNIQLFPSSVGINFLSVNWIRIQQFDVGSIVRKRFQISNLRLVTFNAKVIWWEMTVASVDTSCESVDAENKRT